MLDAEVASRGSEGLTVQAVLSKGVRNYAQQKPLSGHAAQEACERVEDHDHAHLLTRLAYAMNEEGSCANDHRDPSVHPR
ncbi:uncharacterized protein RHO25_004566 [Cercospora beticola]|uniref:Uncharacterized protein n=1 Tax=Cercospora beticola TaxID=122368 RepID=A0ABZ0NK69_CERBT|nr:hypothetical protein RHO25_004566 [Cercospora beticola]